MLGRMYARAVQAREPVLRWVVRDLHIILDALPIALSWATLPDGKIQFVNRAFMRLFGYDEMHFETVDQWIAEVYESP